VIATPLAGVTEFTVNTNVVGVLFPPPPLPLPPPQPATVSPNPRHTNPTPPLLLILKPPKTISPAHKRTPSGQESCGLGYQRTIQCSAITPALASGRHSPEIEHALNPKQL
jgi:hypothetical protein